MVCTYNLKKLLRCIGQIIFFEYKIDWMLQPYRFTGRLNKPWPPPLTLQDLISKLTETELCQRSSTYTVRARRSHHTRRDFLKSLTFSKLTYYDVFWKPMECVSIQTTFYNSRRTEKDWIFWSNMRWINQFNQSINWV